MKNFIQEGTRVDWTNTTGSAVASGDVVIVGSLAAIAVVDIADTKSGEVALEGVYELTKDAPLVISQGDEVFWNTSNKEVTKTATDKPLGVAFRAAASADTTVQVKIYGQGNGIPVAATIAALGTTSNLTALVVTATNIAASNFTAAIPAEPTKAEVDAGIDTLKTAVVTALDLKADNADVETLRTETEARLDAIEAKIDAFLASVKAAGLMA